MGIHSADLAAEHNQINPNQYIISRYGNDNKIDWDSPRKGE